MRVYKVLIFHYLCSSSRSPIKLPFACFSTMSWMDSWSRPGRHAAIPPPFYLTQGDHVAYCRPCGRVISWLHRIQPSASAEVTDLLNAGLRCSMDSASKMVRGDRRIVVTCDAIEEIVFRSRHDPSKTFGRRKNRASRAIGHDDKERGSVDMIDKNDFYRIKPISPCFLKT